MQTAKAIHKHLQKAKKIIIVPHQNPDGDAIGSAVAMFEYVTGMGKKAAIFCATAVSSKLNFVPKDTKISNDPSVFKDDVDVIVTVDSGDLRYAGVADIIAGHKAEVINIDHHATNENFGSLNLVITTAASTTEILYKFFRYNGIRITQKMATALLTGLTEDTGHFTNSATTSSALNTSGELLLSGGNFNLVTANTLKNKSLNALKLWGKAFSRLQKDERMNLTYTYITLKDMEEMKAGQHEAEGISNFLNNMDGTLMTLLLTELPDGKVKGSFRTTKNDVDVSAIAKKFGGGGHKKAAGFTIDGTIEEAIKKILNS